MNEIDYTQNRLAQLKQTGCYPGRDPAMAADRRAQYLRQVQSILEYKSARKVAPLSPFRSVKEWVEKHFSLNIRKKGLMGQNAYLIILLITVISLACTGAALAAAQTSQPAQLLYPLKLISEDIRLHFVTDPQGKFNLLLSFSDRRIEEVLTLRAKSRLVPIEVAARLDDEIQRLFQIAATSDDQAMLHFLRKMRDHLNQYEQQMAIAQKGESGISDPVYEHLRAMLRSMSVFTESGLKLPEIFRQRMRQNLLDSRAGIPTESSPRSEDRQDVGAVHPTPGCTDCEPPFSSTSITPGPFKQEGTAMPGEMHEQGQISGSNGASDTYTPQSDQKNVEKRQAPEPGGSSKMEKVKEKGGNGP